MSGPTLRLCSPFNNSGAPQAYSTFSMPRCNSPAASWEILPCSSPIKRQISSAFFSNNSLNLNITRARFNGGVLRHSGNAALAAATASSMLFAPPKATCLLISPVDGLNTGWVLLLSVTISPLIKWPTVRKVSVCIFSPKFLWYLLDFNCFVLALLHQWLVTVAHKERYSTNISSRLGTRGLLLGEPDAKACSHMVTSSFSNSACSAPNSAKLGTCNS